MHSIIHFLNVIYLVVTGQSHKIGTTKLDNALTTRQRKHNANNLITIKVETMSNYHRLHGFTYTHTHTLLTYDTWTLFSCIRNSSLDVRIPSSGTRLPYLVTYKDNLLSYPYITLLKYTKNLLFVFLFHLEFILILVEAYADYKGQLWPNNRYAQVFD